MCHHPKTPYLVLRLIDDRIMVMKADCKTYACPECGKRRQRDHYIRLLHGALRLREAGERVCFVTLTSHRKLRTYEATKKVFPKAWKKLSMRWKREQSKLEYAMVFESHKDGRLHCHMIAICTVSQSWLKRAAAECGLGYMVNVQELTDENTRKKASYVAKYATKKVGGNSGKNITYSRQFPKPNEMDRDAIIEIWRYETKILAEEALETLGVNELVLRDGTITNVIDMCENDWYA